MIENLDTCISLNESMQLVTILVERSFTKLVLDSDCTLEEKARYRDAAEHIIAEIRNRVLLPLKNVHPELTVPSRQLPNIEDISE